MKNSIPAEMLFQGHSSVAVMEDTQREELPTLACSSDESFNTPMWRREGDQCKQRECGKSVTVEKR